MNPAQSSPAPLKDAGPCSEEMAENVPDEGFDVDPYCSACSGSGEGRYDGSDCYACNGSGVERGGGND